MLHTSLPIRSLAVAGETAPPKTGVQMRATVHSASTRMHLLDRRELRNYAQIRTLLGMCAPAALQHQGKCDQGF